MQKLHWKLAFGLGALLGGSMLLGACGSSGSGGGPSTGGTSGGGTGGSGGSETGGSGNDTATGGGAGDTGTGGATSCAVIPPSSWSAPDWATNAAGAIAVRDLLSALTGSALMQGAETGAVTDLEESDMTNAFNNGEPSLYDVTTEYFRGVVANAFEEFVPAIEAGQQDFVSGNKDDGWIWEPPIDGGIWLTSNRAFNKGGIELRQVVEKGLFSGAAFYNYALQLTTDTIDEATIDSLAVVFGANPEMNPGRNNDENEENRNFFSANYLYAMGFYADARQSLIDAKAYAADEDCIAERDAAIQQFFRIWEQGSFARVVYYSAAGATGVAAAEDSMSLQAAFHLHAEGIGLAMGFYGLETPESGPMSGGTRVITDEAIKDLLAEIGVDVDGQLANSTLGEFVENPGDYAAAVNQLEEIIADAFGWTSNDIQSFHNPEAG